MGRLGWARQRLTVGGLAGLLTLRLFNGALVCLRSNILRTRLNHVQRLGSLGLPIRETEIR